jgi:hypothetical protein
MRSEQRARLLRKREDSDQPGTSADEWDGDTDSISIPVRPKPRARTNPYGQPIGEYGPMVPKKER